MKNTSKNVDFTFGYNNSVVAVYVTAADILTLEDAALRGVPFLSYVGDDQSMGRLQSLSKSSGATYFSRKDISDLLLSLHDPVITNGFSTSLTQGSSLVDGKVLEKCSVGKLPDNIYVRGERVPASKLASWYVPYSFGCGHGSDTKNRLPVRNRQDYRRVMEVEIPLVNAQRKESGSFVNRMLAFFGLYKPFHQLMQDSLSQIAALERKIQFDDMDRVEEKKSYEQQLAEAAAIVDKAQAVDKAKIDDLQRRIDNLVVSNAQMVKLDELQNKIINLKNR